MTDTWIETARLVGLVFAATNGGLWLLILMTARDLRRIARHEPFGPAQAPSPQRDGTAVTFPP